MMYKVLGTLLTLAALFLFVIWDNNTIATDYLTIRRPSLPSEFNQYKILQISDLHNKKFGENQDYLLSKIKKTSPDLIVITGDLIDCDRTNIELAMKLVLGIVKLAPVYYVPGNHEACSGDYDSLKAKLISAGVIVLDNEKVTLNKKNQSISLIGLSDPSFNFVYSSDDNEENDIKNILSSLVVGNNDFTILLSHRPELLDIYSAFSIDIVFSGHAHGGQFRIPFLGGLYAPGQGFLPKLTSGINIVNNTVEVISRGLGNSVMPIRIFNRPELVVVTLEK